jgi:hypothetical protein
MASYRTNTALTILQDIGASLKGDETQDTKTVTDLADVIAQACRELRHDLETDEVCPVCGKPLMMQDVSIEDGVADVRYVCTNHACETRRSAQYEKLDD